MCFCCFSPLDGHLFGEDTLERKSFEIGAKGQNAFLVFLAQLDSLWGDVSTMLVRKEILQRLQSMRNDLSCGTAPEGFLFGNFMMLIF